MTDDTSDPSLDIFERTDAGPLICRVCGCLVPEHGDFTRVHWDWHEASNGA